MASLQTEVTRLESKLAATQSKVAFKSSLLQDKTKEYSEIADKTQINANDLKRADLIQKFTDYLSNFESDINKLVNDLNRSQKTLDNVNKINIWNDFISQMLDKAEDYDLVAQIC